MKKVFLKCVVSDNLGDDLLIAAVCGRYRGTQFTTVTPEKVKGLHIKNLKIIKVNKIIYKIIRKISLYTRERSVIDDYYLAKNDICIAVGGSIFMEDPRQSPSENSSIKWYRNLRKRYYIIGANIGPFYSDEYVSSLKNIVFKKACDVCLRDKKSFCLASGMKNVRMAPDIVFGCDLEKYKTIKERRRVVISVINIRKKADQMKNPNPEQYEKLIRGIINKMRDKRYKVTLMSFCKSEGDEEAIDSILAGLSSRDNIEVVRYCGDVDSALRKIAEAKVVVGTRFHANVLGLLMHKTIIPIIYNDKTNNLLSDIGFSGLSFDANSISLEKISMLNDTALDYKHDIEPYAEASKQHFECLDKALFDRKDI